MTVLANLMREAYIGRTVKNLAELFPDDPSAQDEKAMRALVHTGIARAKKYEITRERETSLFIYLLKAYGNNFDHDPKRRWINLLLTDKDLDGEQKMDLIYARIEGEQ